MSDTTILSPTAGSTPPPTAPSDPVTTPQAPPAAPAATSELTPTTGNQAPTPPVAQTADQAFAALQAETVPEASPAQAATPPPAAPAPAQAEPPATPPAASEPPAAEPDDEPSPAEVQAKAVPLKKLTRALETRRAAKEEAEAAKAELVKERRITDRVLDVFNAIGVTPQQLNPFLSNLARAKSDQQAQAQVLALLGVQPQVQAKPTVDQAKLMSALEAYDVDAIKAQLASAGILSAQQQPPVQAPPVQAAPAQQPTEPPRQANVDPTYANPLVQTVATMGSVLRAQYGEPEAKRLANLIDAEAKATIERLSELEVEVSVKGAAKIWQAAQEKVIQREAAARQQTSTPPAAPPPPAHQQMLRPNTNTAPQRAPTADEMFTALARTR